MVGQVVGLYQRDHGAYYSSCAKKKLKLSALLNIEDICKNIKVV